MDAASFESDLAALKQAQPRWLADTLGVRGNPVESHHEQARVDWPAAGLNRRTGTVSSPPALAGSPEPRDAPAI